MFGIVYVCRCIITNDWKSSDKAIVTFYNKRGESEKNFDVQNNDFGWAHLPFSFLESNTVFILITAMLKNFMLHFICVSAKWIKTGRSHVLNLYTTKDYYSDIFRE